MSTEQLSVFAILLVTFGLLITERLRNDLVAVLIVLSLYLSHTATASEALAGFSSEPAIVVAAIFGRNLLNIILIIGIIYWTSTARLIRAQVKSVRERVYVKRARSIGAGNRRLVFKHVLPQVAPLLIANTVLMIALAVFLETYIAFLGLGDPSTVSWGKLIENSFLGNAVLNNAWWAVVPPGLAVTVVILACTMVGQSMEDALNPRLKVGHLAVRRFRMRPLHGNLEGE